jgi:hypothetical protein
VKRWSMTPTPHSIKVSMSTIMTSEWRLCASFGTACGICRGNYIKSNIL